MFIKKLLSLVQQDPKWKIIGIDGYPYTLHAKSFTHAYRLHMSKFAHEPLLIEPMEYVKGSNQLYGFNKMKYDLWIKKTVYATSEADAIEQFGKIISAKDVVVDKLHPVWVKEKS